MRRLSPTALLCVGLCATAGCVSSAQLAVPAEHPRLLGSRAGLQQLARDRAEAYRRVVSVAREQQADDWAKAMSEALVCAIEGDATLGRSAIGRALKLVQGPVRVGHETFGHDLALCAVVFDLCHEYWTDAERAACVRYVNATADANVNSETHVFHNGWYGYKQWGIGLACLATYHENPRAPAILEALLEDYRARAAPALQLAGAGGGWAEGYYTHWWTYEWLFFCEVARRCAGLDLFAEAPDFCRNRAVASMFEMYPGIREYGSRRPIPMGDSGGLTFGGERDKELAARRILVSHYRDDPAHQYVHAFNETTPRCSVGVYAYKDFLWRDETVPQRELAEFRLSHLSPGAGYVYARSSWDEDATYFFFKCGDRFTAHQHLDVGHFMIYRHEELVGDGGFYDTFASPYISNYYVRSIAHNTVLVLDPEEFWPAIRAAETTGNDGGQHHNWPHHNGAVVDAADWQKDRALYDLGDILAFEDRGDYLYVAGDCTRAYSAAKMKQFVRRIVYLRPGTFIIVDRVTVADPALERTWVLNLMAQPETRGRQHVMTNGAGKLFIQAGGLGMDRIELLGGDGLAFYGGNRYAAGREPPGPIPVCRMEVSPEEPPAAAPIAAPVGDTTWFVSVLTATDATVQSVPDAQVRESETEVAVSVGDWRVAFAKEALGGRIEHGGQAGALAEGIVAQGEE
ncbi:MAG: hypothetical protein FJX74_20055 [Armatimonadetes bacterium]|nr:hypothetical protein [Armatimonadota bacterium]